MSALGIPIVASDVEPYRCIEFGKTGYLAREDGDWKRHLSALIEDEGCRKRIGRLAHKEVRENYNATKIAKKYKKVLEKFTGGKNDIRRDKN